ncbi:MAG: Flp family type IVb pilin, partial [Chloroflexota bacterium]
MKRYPPSSPHRRKGESGQTLVEYALIATLVIVAMFVALAATGDALGRIFNDAVFAALGGADEQLLTPDRDTDGDGVADISAADAFQRTQQWIGNQPVIVVTQGVIEVTPPTPVPPNFQPPTPPPPPPTATAQPTETLVPTVTPVDIGHQLTFEDAYTVINGPDEQEPWYRLENSTFIGLEAWTGRFFQDNASGTVEDPLRYPENFRYSRAWYRENEIGTNQFISPGQDFPNILEENFSAQLRRTLYLRETQTLTFRLVNPGGGVRLYYNDNGACKDFRPPSNARNTSTTSDCMILDYWSDAPPPDVSNTVTFPFVETRPGGGAFPPESEYVLWLEYYQRTGAANLRLEVSSAQVNDEDTGLNGAQVDCNWGTYEGDRSNVRDFAWNAAVGLEGDNFEDNQRCHLELRGYIEAGPEGELQQYSENGSVIFAADEGNYTLGVNQPISMTFWHIWDLNNNTNVSLQVAPYDVDDSVDPPVLTRPAIDDWVTVWNPALNGTRNYE